jgi:hypothetical protein
MSEPFSEKLTFVLKVLSMSRARLAADVGVDKSVVGRWATGAVKPSAHNLSALSALMAQRVPGFTALDWERDLEGLAALFGVEPGMLAPTYAAGLRGGLPLPFLGQILATTAMRGAAYEGFYRSTRPYAANPGRFLHDHCMVRKDQSGLLRLNMATGGVFVDGWVLPLHNQLFIIGAEFTSGALVFGLLHGVNTVQAQIVDGLILSPILDTGRTPTASTIVLERIEDLSGDLVADEARFSQFAAIDPVAPEGSVPEPMREHLLRDIGPAQLALGGDWLLRLPLARSLARGPRLP